MESTLQVRLYNAQNSGWGALPLASDGQCGVLRATGRIGQAEGYAEATLTLAGKRGDFPGLVRRRRVECWAVWKSRSEGALQSTLLYRGIVKRVAPSTDEHGVRTIEVKLYGVWGEIGRVTCYKNYANTYGSDRAAFLSDIARRFVLPTRPDLQIEALPVGSVPDYVEAYDKTFGDVAELLRQNVGQVATGVDVDAATGTDRLFFRPFDDLSLPARHTLYLPDPQTGRQSPEEDDTAQATVLQIRGGAPRYPNLLAEAVQGNTSFEYPQLPGETGAGNYLLNGSFEEIGSATGDFIRDWVEINGAVSKDKDNENVEPFTGSRYVELDHVGEEIFQLRNPTPGTLVAGRTYTLDVRARRQFEDKPVKGILEVEWQQANGSAIRVDTIPVTPTGVTWDLFGQNLVAPVGAVGIRGKLKNIEQGVDNAHSGDPGYGLLLDDCRFFDPSQVTQRGWQTVFYGTAKLNGVRWDEDAVSWHNSRCVYFDIAASDADGQDAWLEPFGSNRFSVTGGQTITGGFALMVPVGSPAFKVLVELREYDGGQIGEIKPAYTVPADGQWHIVTVTQTLQQAAKQAKLHLTFRTTGRIYIDGAFAMDGNAPVPLASDPATFVEGGQYRGTFRADALFAPGTPIHDEAVAVGDIVVVEERKEITNKAEAEPYARAYFGRFALPLSRPSLETFGVLETNASGGSTASMMPGESVRVIGADGSDLLPLPLPLVEKQFTFDGGKLTITPFISVEPRDPYRTIEQMIRAQRLAGGSGSSGGASYNGSLSGSAGPGGGAVAEAGGDLSGTYPNPTVAKLQGYMVSATAPTSGQSLVYNASASQWEPETLSGSGGATNMVFVVDTASDQLAMNPAPTTYVRSSSATFEDPTAGDAPNRYYGGTWADGGYPMDAANAALFYCASDGLIVRFGFYCPYTGTFRLKLDHFQNYNMVNLTYTTDGTTTIGNTMIGANNTPPTNTFVRDFDTGVDVALTRGLNIVRFKVSGTGTYAGQAHNYLAIKRLVFSPV